MEFPGGTPGTQTTPGQVIAPEPLLTRLARSPRGVDPTGDPALQAVNPDWLRTGIDGHQDSLAGKPSLESQRVAFRVERVEIAADQGFQFPPQADQVGQAPTLPGPRLRVHRITATAIRVLAPSIPISSP